MPELVGYLDRWSASPGDVVAVRLSCDRSEQADLSLVRLGRGELRDEADGIAYTPVSDVPLQTLAIEPQAVDAGSFARVDGLDRLDLAQGALAVLAQPWTVSGAEQTIAALGADALSVRVTVDVQGACALRVGASVTTCDLRVSPRRWWIVLLAWGPAGVTLVMQDIEGQSQCEVGLPWPDRPARFANLLLAGAAMPDGTIDSHFDGRLERPVLWADAAQVSAATVRTALLEEQDLPAGAIACWDFSRGMDSQAIVDIGPHGLDGSLHQGPKRAVRGARWAGQVFDWRQAPHEYAAIHFHRDDLLDARWRVNARLELPASLPPGVYAVRVSCREPDPQALTRGQTMLPLFVRAPKAARGGDAARVAVVFPTFTYLAYTNDRTVLFGHNPEVLAARAITLEPSEVLLSQHPAWGLSLYDTHHDGSGVSFASRSRPTPTFQPDQRAWQAGEGGGRWNFPADLLLVEWLEREGIAWHPLTDEDLQTDGASALAPYPVVLTGNHPEYATTQLLDAYRGYLADGGRLMYLGGNGFYWKIATTPSLPGVIELRRAEDGNRSWAEEPGEYYHALEASYGGLWRRNGRAPQSWLGVGYCGQGFRRSTGYRRLPDSDQIEGAFVFEGVTQRDFGTCGAIGGGCAGIEIDRYDVLLGSDPAALVLATSQPFDSTYFLANEEMLVSRPTLSAEFSSSVRADMVLQPTASGGAIWSTGSIAWVGGLHVREGDAAAQRITRNVLMRFLDPAPFAQPARHQP